MSTTKEIANSCKGSTHTFSRFLQTPKYHTKHFLNFSVCATFSPSNMSFENILKTYEDEVIKPSVVIRFDVVYLRVSLKTLNTLCIFFRYEVMLF